MSDTNAKHSLVFFSRRRFDEDFPLEFWFAGLWLYLKSFLYLCNLFVIGTDEPPYSLLEKVEIIYFTLAFLPSFFLGFMLWNEKKWAVIPAIVLLLLLDTPVLILHVIRLSSAGYMDSGLTKILEFGGLALNGIAGLWLALAWQKGLLSVGLSSAQKDKASKSRPNP